MPDFSDDTRAEALSALLPTFARRAEELDVDWLLIGAAARDLILRRALNRSPGRATFDVDVAVEVAAWERMEELKERLSADGVREHPRIKQRLVGPGGATLDVVPFGDVEEDGRIAWPPDSDPLLNVRGLREAHESAETLLLAGGLEVRTPTLEHFLCLKLFAWLDRHHRKPNHDSVDVAEVLRWAENMLPLDELYERHGAAMEESGHDPREACVQIMGARLRRTLLPETRRSLVELLLAETAAEGRLELLRELRVGPWRGLLRALLRGLEERRPV